MSFLKIINYAFTRSDVFGQAIVFLLFFISICLWTYSIAKYLELKAVEEANRRFRQKVENSNSLFDLVFAQNSGESYLQKIYQNFIQNIMLHCGLDAEGARSACRQRRLPRLLKHHEYDMIMISTGHALDAANSKIQKNINHLATIVAASPFFGLLGTVWGVMSAFCGMAQSNSADIGALAPGISGALLTTVVGLLVAIPSLICYNTITARIETISSDMDRFVDELELRLKTESGIE